MMQRGSLAMVSRKSTGDAGAAAAFHLAVNFGRYTQAVIPAKDVAEAAVVSLVFSSDTSGHETAV
jgi:hypothetical protein